MGTGPFPEEVAGLGGAQTLTVLSAGIVARMGSAINLSKDIVEVSCGYGLRGVAIR